MMVGFSYQLLSVFLDVCFFAVVVDITQDWLVFDGVVEVEKAGALCVIFGVLL